MDGGSGKKGWMQYGRGGSECVGAMCVRCLREERPGGREAIAEGSIASARAWTWPGIDPMVLGVKGKRKIRDVARGRPRAADHQRRPDDGISTMGQKSRGGSGPPSAYRDRLPPPLCIPIHDDDEANSGGRTRMGRPSFPRTAWSVSRLRLPRLTEKSELIPHDLGKWERIVLFCGTRHHGDANRFLQHAAPDQGFSLVYIISTISRYSQQLFGLKRKLIFMTSLEMCRPCQFLIENVIWAKTYCSPYHRRSTLIADP